MTEHVSAWVRPRGFFRDRFHKGSPLRKFGQRAAKTARDEAEALIPADALTLRVATWNIHSCVGTDSRFSPERVAEVIRELDVDVIGLQEVGWHHRGEVGLDQFALLGELTGLTAIAAPTKHHRLAHYGNAILTRLPVLASRPLNLAVGWHEPRGGVLADLDAGGGQRIRVLSAHFGLDPWERNAQTVKILTLCATLPDIPTLFMGDLNEWRPRAAMLRRLEAYFDDSAAPRSFHARMPTLRLDRVYVTGGLILGPVEVMRTPLTGKASDHLPVRATIAVAASVDQLVSTAIPLRA